MRDLVLLHSQGFVAYAVASGLRRGNLSNIDLCVVNGDQPGRELSDRLRWSGVRFVSLEAAREHAYAELHVLPFFSLFASFDSIVSSLRFSKLIAHADAMRNGLFALNESQFDIEEIVHYGFELKERAVELSSTQQVLECPRTIVTLREIEGAWRILAGEAAFRLQGHRALGEKDLLIVLRHWGVGYYSFRPGIDMSVVLREHIVDFGAFDRVILRSHPWDEEGGRIARSYLAGMSAEFGFQLHLWEDLGLAEFLPPILDNPEAAIFLGVLGEVGTVFAFDSSLNWVCASMMPKAKVLWPRGDLIDGYFERGEAAEIVSEQVSWMRELVWPPVLDQTHGGRIGQIPVMRTSGFGIQKVLYSMLVAEFRALVAQTVVQRDEAVVQRDEAVVQRDEAVVQRDEAVVQREEAVVRRDEAVVQRDEAVVQRDEAAAALNQILSSRSWRLVTRLRRIAGLWKGRPSPNL